MTKQLAEAKKELRAYASLQKVASSKRFFKTGKGEYGEGDRFLGLTVPEIRMVAKTYRDLGRPDTLKLLTSPFHEERMFSLITLVHQYKHAHEAGQKEIYNLYLGHTKYINNWDLVDMSAEHIVGAYLADKPALQRKTLAKLAKSKLIWERRIAMLATFHYIKKGSSKEALKIASMLVNDSEDLIQKAVGWMLREVGQKCSLAQEQAFLKIHAVSMPRTMLRYAIEKFPKKERLQYLSKKRI